MWLRRGKVDGGWARDQEDSCRDTQKRVHQSSRPSSVVAVLTYLGLRLGNGQKEARYAEDK